MSKTVMVVGAGAREHALAEAYMRNPEVTRVVVTPGNPGMILNAPKELVVDPDGSLTDPQATLAVAQKHQPDLTEVAQDDALAGGTVDLLQQAGFAAFGPTRDAAQLEWDKAWSRDFMQRHGIVTPQYRTFTTDQAAEARQYLQDLYADNAGYLCFVKAAGLAAGKGALKATNLAEAEAAVTAMAGFGEAGASYVIEEGIIGEEFSYYAISDGTNFACFPSVQDNKRALDDDEGEQTGGIGATVPAQVTTGRAREIEEQMIAPVIDGLRAEGRPYVGVLYLGGIVAEDGRLVNIEYNARWGDPECQCVLPGLQGDYFELVQGALRGALPAVENDGLVRIGVVGCATGYPGDYSAVKGRQIHGLPEAIKESDVSFYSTAVEIKGDQHIANGGRLFTIVGRGATIVEARDRAYAAMEHISIDDAGLHYRTDIGRRDLERWQNRQTG